MNHIKANMMKRHRFMVIIMKCDRKGLHFFLGRAAALIPPFVVADEKRFGR
jgi:hypothetical protein